MRRIKKVRNLLAACGLVAAMAVMSPAAATSFSITSATVPNTPGWVIGTIYHPQLENGSEAVYIGRINLSGTDQAGGNVSFDTWCADIFDTLQAGTFTAATSSAMPYDAARVSAATTFLAHADPLVVNATTSAATQLGLWEILNEDEGRAWNVTDGTFHADVDAAVAAQADDWLGALADRDWQPDPAVSLVLFQPGAGNQLQVQVGRTSAAVPVSGVPETTSWAMMLFGLGAVGGLLRSQRGGRRTLEIADER